MTSRAIIQLQSCTVSKKIEHCGNFKKWSSVTKWLPRSILQFKVHLFPICNWWLAELLPIICNDFLHRSWKTFFFKEWKSTSILYTIGKKTIFIFVTPKNLFLIFVFCYSFQFFLENPEKTILPWENFKKSRMNRQLIRKHSFQFSHQS